MAPFMARLHLLEINDQSWFPDFLRRRVQACLTLLWTFRVPFLQPCSPASLVAQTLLRILGDRSSRYTYVDFCSGAGGPTLAIEKEFNARLNEAFTTSAPTSSQNSYHGSDTSSNNGEDNSILTPQSSPTSSHSSLLQRRSNRLQAPNTTTSPLDKPPAQAHFVLTDIAPHISAWDLAAKQSTQIRYVPSSIDASSAPRSLLSLVSPTPLSETASSLPIFRLFSLAFHHFDDPLAIKILENTLETSSGFAILELQQRTLSSLVMTVLLFPLLLLITPFFFWNDPVHLLFTYLIPVVPLVVSLDGMVSSVRTRTGEEVKAMVDRVLNEEGELGQWDVIWGSEWHTWPIGEMSWVVGLKRSDSRA